MAKAAPLSRRAFLRRGSLSALALALQPLLLACQSAGGDLPPPTPPVSAIREVVRATPTPAVTPEPTATPVHQASIKVSFLGGTLAGMQKLYDGVFHGYQDANPDVAVVGTYVGATAPEIQGKVVQLYAAGTPPDVYWVHSYSAAALAELGIALNLAPYLRSARGVDPASFYPVALADFQFAGQQGALPRDTTSVVLAYNKDLFQKAGMSPPRDTWTWDDYNAAAQRLTSGTGGKKVWGTAGWIQTGYAYNSWIRLWQKGGDVVDADRARYTLDSPTAVETYAWIVDLVARGLHPPTAEGSGNPSALFSTGFLAMLPTISTYPTLGSGKVNWDIQHLPSEGKRLTRASSSGHSLTSTSTRKDAGWALLAFLASDAAMRAYATAGLTPARRDIAEATLSAAADTGPASARIALDALATSRPEPMAGDWLTIHQTIASALEDVYGPSRSPIQPTLAGLADRVNQLLATLPSAPT
jgi:multiple sugar transport system substrate-binding protein